MKLRPTALLFTVTVALAACAGEKEGDSGPLLIDDELLKDTFEECEIDMEQCLDDENVLGEIYRRVEAGEWAWDDIDEGLDAAGVTFKVLTGCTFSSTARASSRRACQSRGGSLVRTTWFRHCSTSGTNRYKATCAR